MKFKTLATVLLLTLSTNLFAELYFRGGLYFASSESIAVESNEDFRASIDADIGFNVAVGYQFNYFRLEGEFSTLRRDIDGGSVPCMTSSGSLDRNSVLANILFEFPATPFFEPYIGAGIGISQLDFSMESGVTVNGQALEFSGSQDDLALSFQLMGGLRFSFGDSISVYVGYRYFSAESISISETGYSVDTDSTTGLFELGMGFGF